MMQQIKDFEKWDVGEVLGVQEVGDYWTGEGHGLILLVWYHHVEFLCVFLSQPFSEEIFHICEASHLKQ